MRKLNITLVAIFMSILNTGVSYAELAQMKSVPTRRIEKVGGNPVYLGQRQHLEQVRDLSAKKAVIHKELMVRGVPHYEAGKLTRSVSEPATGRYLSRTNHQMGVKAGLRAK